MKDFFNAITGGIFRGDPNRIDAEGMTRLQRAVMKNDLSGVVRLLKYGADVNLRGRLIYPPLHLALEKDRHTIAMALIQAGADLNLQDTTGRTPLHRAAAQSQEGFVQTLLDLGADPNITDHAGNTPLHVVGTARPEIVTALAEHGADLNLRNREGETPLHIFIDTPQIFGPLLRAGADVNQRGSRGFSPFALALSEARAETQPETLARMLNANPDLSTPGPSGEPALHIAARLCLRDIFDSVLRAGDPLQRDLEGNNVLHALLRSPHLSVMSSMMSSAVARAPDLLTQKNNRGMTVIGELVRRANQKFFYAGRDKVDRVARLLVGLGADVNAPDEDGNTLLHYAVRQEDVPLAEFLVNHGADLNARNTQGVAPLHYAAVKDDIFLLDMLLDSGADPNLVDDRGWTLLDRLAEKGDRDSCAVQRLIVGGGQYEKQLPLNPDLMRRPNVQLKKPGPGGLSGGPGLK